MAQILTIELTDTQYKGLEYIGNPQDWANNAVTQRARVAVDNIVEITVQYCLDNGVQVPATRDDIVAYAYDNNIVQRAADVVDSVPPQE